MGNAYKRDAGLKSGVSEQSRMEKIDWPLCGKTSTVTSVRDFQSVVPDQWPQHHLGMT